MLFSHCVEHTNSVPLLLSLRTYKSLNQLKLSCRMKMKMCFNFVFKSLYTSSVQHVVVVRLFIRIYAVCMHVCSHCSNGSKLCFILCCMRNSAYMNVSMCACVCICLLSFSEKLLPKLRSHYIS